MRSAVALFTRAWIEITAFCLDNANYRVALFTRAWIEIASQNYKDHVPLVALFTRAWIEIFLLNFMLSQDNCRPLHEGVD